MRDILIVDGYNVLRSSRLYSSLQETASGSAATDSSAMADKEGLVDTPAGFSTPLDFSDYANDHRNALREALINDVAVFAYRRFEATVVFDGQGNPQSTGERSEIAGVSVIFSAAGVSADSVIEELVYAATSTGRKVLVITSDATLQWTVLGTSVTRMSAAGFADEMSAIKKATINDIKSVAYKNTLAERLDKETRERLARMARGLDVS